jgi:Peptidase A4 family
VPHSPKETYRFTVPPHMTSHVRVQSLPDAVCTVQQEGIDSPSLLVYSDPEGFLDLHVRPATEHYEISKLAIEAEAGDVTVHHMLELRASRKPTAEMPSPPVFTVQHPRQAKIRRALGLDEALQTGQEELLARGYPIRPDADEAPQALAYWLQAVTLPAISVEPHVIVRPDIRHVRPDKGDFVRSAENDQTAQRYRKNWSGFALESADTAYNFLRGRWVIPSVTGESNKKAYSAIWIGLDGDITRDLFQAGTAQDSIRYQWPFEMDVSTYHFWMEFLPLEQHEHQITNFPVRPGDEILCDVWIGNPQYPPTLAGTQANVYAHNVTLGHYYLYGSYSAHGLVQGSSAEWILERPALIHGQEQQLSDLANYGSTTMETAIAQSEDGNYVWYNSAPNMQLTMYDGDDFLYSVHLSTVTPINYTSMRFDWHAFHY